MKFVLKYGWITCLFFLLVAEPVYAHKVMIFGWTEGDRVETISKFSGGKRVQNAPVMVYGPDGSLLLSGKTNTKGEFSFSRPAVSKLKLVLEATMGHKTTCEVELKDPVSTEETENTMDDAGVQVVSEKESGPCSSKEIEAVVEKTLDRKLGKILQLIQEKEDKQKISDIIGGIGYILGLIGIGLWFKNR